nr:hypothetical protein [Bacillaceae bacterium]
MTARSSKMTLFCAGGHGERFFPHVTTFPGRCRSPHLGKENQRCGAGIGLCADAVRGGMTIHGAKPVPRGSWPGTSQAEPPSPFFPFFSQSSPPGNPAKNTRKRPEGIPSRDGFPRPGKARIVE